MSSLNENATTINNGASPPNNQPHIPFSHQRCGYDGKQTPCLHHHNHLVPHHHGQEDEARHLKVDGRGRRIYISSQTAARLFELTRQLNHRNHGETVEWLLHKLDESRALTAVAAMPAQEVMMTPAAAPPPLLTSVTVPSYPVRMQSVPVPDMVGLTGQYQNVPVENLRMQSVEEEFGKSFFGSVEDSYFDF